ncbi:MAG: right-handed parallel beta-helix repeat-containing protein, partial [Candidatus Sumerlaeota bacterium]|nr:right-handed parallel beta-helix repeat-containing protein [Candidatus Sumerlaeota bacterium]
MKWLKDGYDFTGNTNTAVQVSMDVDHILTAIYSPVLPTLTVTSLNPDSGVAISVSGADFSGLTNGTTQFTRDYNADTTVTLTAPNTANGDTFLKWLKNGAGFEGQENKSILVTVNADTTMTAMYNAATSGPFYVDGAAGSDLNDGLSWATSKRTMQAAINANSNYHQIWVKQGTYVTSLTMRSNVSLYGGFAGTETSLTKRDIKANTTIIDGGTTPSSGNSWATVTLDSVTTVIIDGFTITGGSDHGIACSNADQTNTIINCDIIGNGTSSYGGGINLYSSSLLITSCSISGNDKGGVYASISYADFTNCVISGNKGAGVRHNSWTPYFAYLRFYNCIISGNEGRAMDGGSYSYPDFENCTISRNKAFAALYCFYDHNYTDIYNCIFEGNEGNAIYEDGDSGDFVHAKIINCLFDNGGKDYLEKGGILRRGADNINAVSGNGGNWSGSAMFVMDGPSGTTGTWTAAPAYDPNAYRSALVDAAASFAPNALAGKLITPNVSNLPQLYIVSNSATTMVVVGDARSYTTQGATYKIVDYHLRDGSRALDRGNQSYAPSKDFEGNLRPGSDGKVDIGAYEASAAYQPGTDDGVAPVSSVSSLASLTYTAAFNVAFSAYDDDSGLKEIRLFYRLNGGSWTQYPDAMTTYSISNSPISFNSALTGGDGIYEFYTIATDKAGNVESAPASADSRTHVVSSFSGSRVYVNQNATGLQTGFDWPNALTSISEANSIAIHYSVPEVWVATGAYYACITLGSDIAIYGGFAGTESSLGERNITSNVTSIKSWSTGYPTIKMDTITTAVLDGFMIAGSAMNPAAGGGVYCKGLNASCLIANCSIANNSASSGGGIYFLTASPRIVNCAISGNSATNGGGIYISGGAPAFSNCRISGNTAPSGGGVYANASNANFINCIISGNQASQYGGGAFCNNSSAPYPSFINCTVSDNSAISSGGGILCQNYSSPAITNTIFARNTRQAIYEQSVNADPVVKNCLFNGNPDGDYCDENTASITGAAAINALPGNSGNVSGSPKFKMDGTLAITGTWTTAPAYDSSLKQTVLTDSRAPFASLSLAGRLIAPNLSSNSQALILSNTASQIMAQGDLSSWVYSGSSYVIADYHLEYPSAAIDAGTSAAAPAMDMEGNARPLDIPGMGIEGANAYDIGAYEASWSSLLPVNDSFSSASIIAGVASSTRGANRLGTKESGEPNHAGNAGGASVWWKWTAPETGAYIFDTHGSDFNTLFSIYTGASVSALTQVAANDDDGSANGNSGLIFTAQAGVQYRIAVDGFGGASGSIMLNWTERRTLTVASMSPNSGILMTVSPLDNNGDGSGMTQFSRFYYHGTTVTLTAPLGAPNGNLFYRWLIDGAEFAGNQSRTVQVLMNT